MNLACTVDRIGTPKRFFVASLLIGLSTYLLGYEEIATRFFIALVLTTGLVGLLKILFRVKRPKDATFVLHSFSFPSGHAAGVVFLGASLMYIVAEIAGVPQAFAVGAATLPFIFLVAWSRVALRVHTTFQVLAGALIGIAIPMWVYLANVQ